MNNSSLIDNSYELMVKSDDKDFSKVSQKFINKLEKSYKNHEKEINKKEEEWKENREKLKKTNSYYELEIIKSAITIIDAPFGTGKSYFIGKLVENLIIKKKIKSKIFKNIIVIDVFKYANSKNIPEEFLFELFNVICTKFTKIKKNIWNFFKNIISSIDINTPIASIKMNKIINDFEKNNKNERLIKKIEKELETTIIILDNVERLENNSWKIIKIIQKISKIKKFVFVLPMHLKYLKNNKQLTNNDELPIEKFINIPCFNFKQDYLSFLHKLNLNDDEKVLINEILNEEIDGRKLSIREVEQIFLKYPNFKNMNKYEKIKTLSKIWNSNFEIIKKYIEENKSKDENLKILNEQFAIYKNLKQIFLLDNSFKINHYKEKYPNNFCPNRTNNLNNCKLFNNDIKCKQKYNYENINEKYENRKILLNYIKKFKKYNYLNFNNEKLLINISKKIGEEILNYLNFIRNNWNNTKKIRKLYYGNFAIQEFKKYINDLNILKKDEYKNYYYEPNTFITKQVTKQEYGYPAVICIEPLKEKLKINEVKELITKLISNYEILNEKKN